MNKVHIFPSIESRSWSTGFSQEGPCKLYRATKKEKYKEWDLEDIAVHVKGLEPAGHDPRTLKGMGLAYATSDRGACHLRATFYKPELAGMIPPDQIEGKAEMFLDFEDRIRNLFPVTRYPVSFAAGNLHLVMRN